jgi:hypothetical protein
MDLGAYDAILSGEPAGYPLSGDGFEKSTHVLKYAPKAEMIKSGKW